MQQIPSYNRQNTMKKGWTEVAQMFAYENKSKAKNNSN